MKSVLCVSVRDCVDVSLRLRQWYLIQYRLLRRFTFTAGKQQRKSFPWWRFIYSFITQNEYYCNDPADTPTHSQIILKPFVISHRFFSYSERMIMNRSFELCQYSVIRRPQKYWMTDTAENLAFQMIHYKKKEKKKKKVGFCFNHTNHRTSLGKKV